MAAGYRRSIAASIQDPPAAYGNLPGSAKATNACTLGWTDERVTQLRELWSAGLSASQIAKKLTGITRNAVIGKANRMGLEGRARPSAPRAAPIKREPRPQTRTYPRFAMAPAVMHIQPTSQPKPPTVLRVCDDKPGEHASGLVDLGSHQCRWPLGPMLEPSHLFCGEPLDEDRPRNVPPYCTEHLERCLSQQAKKFDGKGLERSLRRYFTEKVAA